MEDDHGVPVSDKLAALSLAAEDQGDPVSDKLPVLSPTASTGAASTVPTKLASPRRSPIKNQQLPESRAEDQGDKLPALSLGASPGAPALSLAASPGAPALSLAASPGAPALSLAASPDADALSLAARPEPAAMVVGGSMDPLSRVPYHLRAYILRTLPVKECIMTSALSREWRDLWTQLPILEFQGFNYYKLATALAAYKAHGEDDIHGLTVLSNQMNGHETTAWLRLAVPILAGRLYFDNSHTVSPEARDLFLNDAQQAVLPAGAIEFPCFNKATELLMDFGFLCLELQPAGIFQMLKVMSLNNFRFGDQLSIVDTMFPALEELSINRVRGLAVLRVDSTSLLYLHLSDIPQLKQIDAVAPRLEELQVTNCYREVPEEEKDSVIDAKRLQILRWEVPCLLDTVFLRKMSPLLLLSAPPISSDRSEEICAEFLNCFPTVHKLELQINFGMGMDDSLLWMERIIIPNVNVVSLSLATNGHAFEERVLQLLYGCHGIIELNLSFQARHEEEEYCYQGCICSNVPTILEAQVVQIRGIQKIQIINFHGRPREVNLLEELVRRSAGLQLLRVFSKVDEDCLDCIVCPPGCTIEIYWDG